jgi:hypothetical protein
VLLYFFLGFVVDAQIGGRMLDRVGAKRPVVLGCVLAAVGFDSGRGRSPSSTSADRSRTSSSPAPAWASCSGRPPPTRSTGLPGSRTERPRASPRPSATTPPASVSPSSGRSSSTRCAPTSRPHSSRKGGASSEAAHISESHQSGGTAAIPQFVRLDFADASHAVLHTMSGVKPRARRRRPAALRWWRRSGLRTAARARRD